MRVMNRSLPGRALGALLALLCGVSIAGAQATTGTVAGTIKDAQGGLIPGATVTIVSDTKGTAFDAVSNATGDFVLSNIPGDTYTVRVSMDGFKTLERKDVRVSPGDRVAIGSLTLEVGALAETVMVAGDAPMIQAQTGDRSFTVTRESVENLPVAGRNFASFAALTPGVIGTANANTGALTVARADGARTNYLLDGVSSVDTGGNQQGLQINPDAIAEVKVIANSYQAEYGRTSGIQISGVTKSGSNQFKGSGYDIERRTAWNSNTWANARNGNPKPTADQRDWGYTIGGPVGKPGGRNSLFFFYSEQFSPRSTGGAINRFRVPTELERHGDFSKSTDNTGAPIPYIRDTTTGLACSATDTSGCFKDGDVLGRIPQDRLYQIGLNVLNSWPLPNTSGVNYNLETVGPTVHTNTYQHVVRVDYQISPRLRVSAKYAGSNATVVANPGSIPGFNDALTKFPANLIPSATVDYTLNATTVFEGTWGLTQGNERAGNGVMINDSTNKFNRGLGDFPTLYPAAIVPVGSYQERVLKAMNVPFYRDGRLQLPPQFTWGSRVGNTAPPNTLYNGFLCWQRTNDIALSVTKLWRAHTFKLGYQSQDSVKQQNVGTQTAGVLAPEGSVNFGNDSNNPFDTGFGFANAAIGVFSSFQQQNALIEGDYVYHNKDFYAQDNWKVTSKLTLDYGMRFTHHGPQYDTKGQASNFFPEKWSANNAPSLYIPGCAVAITANGCPSASRVAMNPLTTTSLGVGSSLAIGTLVPGSGVITNGIIQAGQGIAKENYVEQSLVFGPRAGVAYDLTGEQKYVIRGAVGYFYDRPQGDSIFGQSGNPPTGQQSTLFYSTLQSIAAGATALQPAPASLTYYYDAKIGSSLNWNGGMQFALPWASSADISYVGAHNYNSIAFGSISTPAGQLPIDRNAPDTGTAYLAQYQDPTRAASNIPGATALTTDLLRPYRGLGAITTTWPRFHTQYDSLQTSFNRRFRNGWQAGLAWTLGLRFTGNTLSPQHFVHNADGTIGLASFQAADDAIINNVGLRRHIIKVNAVWNLPELKGTGAASHAIGAVVNGWQLAGVLTAGSTAPYDATYSYQSNGANVNLTGSPSYAARIKVVGDIGKGCSKNPYQQFNPAGFQGPTYYSTGNESGSNLLKGCGDHTVDMSIQRNIRFGSRGLQFRLDAFNVFNAIIFNARVTGIQYSSPADPSTIQNSQYNADGTLDSRKLTPASAGAGAATGAQAMRSLQAQIRFMF